MNLLRNLAAFGAVLLDELLVRLTRQPTPAPLRAVR